MPQKSLLILGVFVSILLRMDAVASPDDAATTNATASAATPANTTAPANTAAHASASSPSSSSTAAPATSPATFRPPGATQGGDIPNRVAGGSRSTAPTGTQLAVSGQASYQVNGAGSSEDSKPGASSSSADTGSLKLTPDKSEYHTGEVMLLKVQVPPAAGHLRVYGVAPDGSTTVLFPNRWETDDTVHASEQRSIPASPSLNYDLVLTLKPGETSSKEQINAIFSPEPFTDTQSLDFKSSPFVEIGTTTVEQRASRGLKPTAKVQAVNVAVPYEIIP